MTATVIDNFAAEAKQLGNVLEILTDAQWQAESAAKGWSVADVVLAGQVVSQQRQAGRDEPV